MQPNPRTVRDFEAMMAATNRVPQSLVSEDDSDLEMQADAATARLMLRTRRKRESEFGGDLFADPVWDMLLDLFAAQCERRCVSFTSLCIASMVPTSTARRWIRAMLTDGWLIERPDPNDRRRMLMFLTPDAMIKVRRLVQMERMIHRQN